MRRYPGEVWFLPPEAEEGGDSKASRHILLTPCDDSGDVGVFAYASTQRTEARFGAAWLRIDPTDSRHLPSGFSKPTYVYPGRLVPAASEDFLRMVGRLIDEMPELRRRLQAALGLGMGTVARADAAAGSWRGKVVELSATRRALTGYARAVVLTDPEYSAQNRYQIIVPLEDPREFEAAPGDLEIQGGEWIRMIDPHLPGVLLAVADVQSVFHPVDIAGWNGAVVDDASMDLLERALVRLFAL
ncbi:MAG TPA: hypothetical protein VF541_11290 [Longimicrobium sp.]|jgi:hypothetical protein